MLEYIILGYLFTAPMTENAIRSHILIQIKPFYMVTQGSLYPALKRMVTKQYIVLRPIDSTSKQKQYYITDKGRDHFMKWMEQPVRISQDYTAQLLRVFFAGNLAPDARERMLTEFEMNTMIDLQKLEVMTDTSQGMSDLSSKEFFQRATLYFGIFTLRGSLKWCQSLKKGIDLKEFL
ncbi:MAG: PadR family transcriptional regulator [Lachnospiraceae bacterium]|nr:PadR family transcriptional regulator [Lachnospiraceae bacterium]